MGEGRGYDVETKLSLLCNRLIIEMPLVSLRPKGITSDGSRCCKFVVLFLLPTALHTL